MDFTIMGATLIACSRLQVVAAMMILAAAAPGRVKADTKASQLEALINSGWWDHLHRNISNIVPCEWLGITCDAAGQVTEIDLYGASVGGHKFRNFSFHAFPQLAKLSLSKCGLNGTIPPQISGLSRLLILNLSYNQLTGQLPEILGQLPNLQFIDLCRNNFTGPIPSTILQFQNQSVFYTEGYLDLSNNALTGPIPESFGNMKCLYYLGLHHNRITGDIPSSLWNLPNLQYIYLQSNQLTGQLPHYLPLNLKALDLSHNNFYGRVPSFQEFPMYVDISYNSLQGNLPAIFSSINPSRYAGNPKLCGALTLPHCHKHKIPMILSPTVIIPVAVFSVSGCGSGVLFMILIRKIKVPVVKRRFRK